MSYLGTETTISALLLYKASLLEYQLRTSMSSRSFGNKNLLEKEEFHRRRNKRSDQIQQKSCDEHYILVDAFLSSDINDEDSFTGYVLW